LSEVEFSKRNSFKVASLSLKQYIGGEKIAVPSKQFRNPISKSKKQSHVDAISSLFLLSIGAPINSGGVMSVNYKHFYSRLLL
jgi:hypothetical protein